MWWKVLINQSWQNIWNKSPITNLKKIKQTTAPWNDPLDHSDQRVVTRLRIGHTRLTHTYKGSVCSALCKALIKHMRLTHMWFTRIVYLDHLLKPPHLISPCLQFCRSTTYFQFFFAIGQAALNVRGSSSNAPYRSIEPSPFSSPLPQ